MKGAFLRCYLLVLYVDRWSGQSVGQLGCQARGTATVPLAKIAKVPPLSRFFFFHFIHSHLSHTHTPNTAHIHKTQKKPPKGNARPNRNRKRERSGLFDWPCD